MADYTPSEIVDMTMILRECRGQYREAAQRYCERYPDRRHPNHRVISRCVKRARRGFLSRNVNRPVSNLRNTAVLASVFVNPTISTPEIERLHNVPQSTAFRILRRNRFHPYHISLHQELSDNDFDRRLRFCRWAHRTMCRDSYFFRYVLFSDESNFNNRGEVNRHNYHYWSDNNPHWLRSVPHQHRWSFNVWCGILNGRIIGPYFFDNTLTGQRYNDFIRNKLWELLHDVELATRQRIWFQQDGAPAHYDRRVRATLNDMFPNRWIGRGGRIEFPPRSPDLTPLDFFLWGYLKNKVYVQNCTTPGDLKQRILDVCQEISTEMLENVDRSFRDRVNLCIQAGGRIFEHQL